MSLPLVKIQLMFCMVFVETTDLSALHYSRVMLIIYLQYLWQGSFKITENIAWRSRNLPPNMFWTIALIRCIIVWAWRQMLFLTEKEKSHDEDSESTVISGEDKDYSRWEAVCLSGAVIETGACLMCSDCYEFTDRLVGFIRICNIRKKERSLRPFPKKRQLWACVRADTRSLKGQLIAKN